MHTKRRRQRHSKRKGGRRSSRSHLTRSSSHCNQKLMTMFKKYNTPRYRSALEPVMRELLKYHPLAIIEFIEMHFNETAILAHFNNEKCLKIHLDTLKQQLHQYKEKNGKTKTHDKFTKFTMEHASRIIKKGYGTFSKSKLRGGAGDEESSPPPPPPPPRPPEPEMCPVCFDNLDDGTGSRIIHPTTCPLHKAHSACLRSWWRTNPICPMCREPGGDLPPLLPEEEPAERAAILLEQQQAPLAQQWEQEYQLQLEQQLQLQLQQQQLQTQAERLQRRNAMLAFIVGLFGSVFYNLEYIMEVFSETMMMVDPTMGATEMAIGSFAMISMFLLAFLGNED